MKIAAVIAFICFMGVSVYVLLNEKNMRNPHAKVAALRPTSTSKKIGEKRRPDFPIYELQRQRIESETIYKFESKNKDENYEMDEEELEAFSRGLNGLRDARDAGQVELYSPYDVNTLKHDEDYYKHEKDD